VGHAVLLRTASGGWLPAALHVCGTTCATFAFKALLDDLQPTVAGSPTASLPPHCAPRSCSNIPADVYFLADNTGSMYYIISTVQSGATTILNDLAASSELGDLRVGVGAYRDRFDDFVFSHRVGLTADTAAAAAAINTWSAAGGYDEPEGQLYALYKASRLLGCLDEVLLAGLAACVLIIKLSMCACMR